MLDVHPPHHAANTWRDFFIHIATICVGLLIAIALEQSVEALHRHHQRNELRQELRTEAEENKDYIDNDMKVAEAYLDWALDATARVNATPRPPPSESRASRPALFFSRTPASISPPRQTASFPSCRLPCRSSSPVCIASKVVLSGLPLALLIACRPRCPTLTER